MIGMLGSATAGAVAFALLPAVRAHNALWHPSMYGFNDQQASWPLGGMSFDQWWFHGNLDDPPTESMAIPAGQTLTVELACRKTYSSWGSAPDADACPQDSGAYHAGGTTDVQSGWQGNDEAMLLGCALAIAYKSDASAVQPEDFTVMSIQPECVRRRDTAFEIPANLPACPEGGCTCAWFWSGKNSADEMYMTGFKCNVEGGVATSSYPQPVEPRKGRVGSGPTQPYYWSNDRSNMDYTPNWGNKPSYNDDWGYSAGAQSAAFEGLGGSGSPAPAPAPAPMNSTSVDAEAPTSSAQNDGPAPTVISTSAGQESDVGNGSGGSRTRTPTRTRATWYNHAAAPTDGAESAAAAEASEVAPVEQVNEAEVDEPSNCPRSRRSRRRRHVSGHH